MRVGVRGHDISTNRPEELCERLKELGVKEIQLVAHKSFERFVYEEDSVSALAQMLEHYGIHVAIYGCYVDPSTKEGQTCFLKHIRYAKILKAGAIATESAIGITNLQEDEGVYRELVQAIRCFAREAKTQGVRCAIETVQVHPICSPEKTARLLHDVGSDNLYVILDPVNLMASPDDPERFQKTERAIQLYGERILAVHWKDEKTDFRDPALAFARANEQVTVITEGLNGKKLENVICNLKREMS